MIGEQHKRINLGRRHGPAHVDRPAEQRPGRVVTKESGSAIRHDREEKRAAGSQGTAIVRHVRYNYRNGSTGSRDGPQEYLRTLHGFLLAWPRKGSYLNHLHTVPTFRQPCDM